MRTSAPGAFVRDYVEGGFHADDRWMEHCAASTRPASIDTMVVYEVSDSAEIQGGYLEYAAAGERFSF